MKIWVLFKLTAILLLFTSGCKDVAVPRPEGHFRIDLPEKEYIILKNRSDLPQLPFSFEYPVYGKLTFGNEYYKSEKGWFNIEFPSYNAKIYLTYKEVNNDLDSLLEQTYRINFMNHISKADAINEKIFTNDEERVFGILYDLKGNTATAVQFYATDSTRHYLRGSLYFNAEPDADSLAPVIQFFREDILHLVETLKWND